MSLIALLKREEIMPKRDVIIALGLSGVANTAILATINTAAQTVSFTSINAQYLGMFLAAMALYVLTLIYIFNAATRLVEQTLLGVRNRLTERIARAELRVLDKVGKARIFQAITQDTTLISESQGLLVAAAQSVAMIAFTALYVTTLSIAAFMTILGAVLAGIVIYVARENEMNALLKRNAAEMVRFVGLTGDLIDGMKELKLNRRRQKDMLADVHLVSANVRDAKSATTNLYNKNAVFSQTFFFALIGIVVFLLPRVIQGTSEVVPQLVATVLFIIGPLSTIVTALPAYNKANESANSLIALEEELVGLTSLEEEANIPRPLTAKRTIGCRDLSFRYDEEDIDSFGIGPIDLELACGEVIMFVGGNGSGKTTFLKVLAGLYPPTDGVLTIDGRAVPRNRHQNYREMFGAIYNDFHLFPKLYGIAAAADQVDAQLERLQIEDKVIYDDSFSTLDLSTGQRKRVAMAVSLLEDRPIVIFDEWAAEQDPEFRQYFYEELLPHLRAKGKTLLVATHDDRYFDTADTIVTMELGRVRSVIKKETP